jgi:hypothetical protein
MKHSYDLYRIKQIIKGFKDSKIWKLFLDEEEKDFVLLVPTECEVAFSVSINTPAQECIWYTYLLLNRKKKHNIKYLPLSSIPNDVHILYRLTVQVPSRKVPNGVQIESCKLFLDDLFVGNLRQPTKYEYTYIVPIVEYVNINKKIFF